MLNKITKKTKNNLEGCVWNSLKIYDASSSENDLEIIHTSLPHQPFNNCVVCLSSNLFSFQQAINSPLEQEGKKKPVNRFNIW